MSIKKLKPADMPKYFVAAFFALFTTNGMYAQATCDCTKSEAVIEYTEKASGSNSPVCSHCAQLAYYKCLCTECPTNYTPEQLQKMIAQIAQTLKSLDSSGVGVCCDYKNLPDCAAARKSKAGLAAAGSNEVQKTQQPTLGDYNNSYVDVVNTLGANSNDPGNKKFVENTNNIHQAFGDVKTIGATEGTSQKALNTIDGLETGAHLFNIFFGRFFNEPDSAELLEKEAQLQAQQVEHDSARYLLRSWHKSLRELKKTNPNHDSITAQYRLIALRSNQYELKNKYITRAGLNKIAKKTNTELSQYGTAYLLKEIDEYFKKHKSEDYLLEYLGNGAEDLEKKRVTKEKENLELFSVPPTFNPEKDKLLSVIKNGKGKVTSLYIYTSPKYQLVYEFNATEKKGKLGWDGKYNNEIQPAGSYFYTFTVTDDKGESVGKSGTFTLVR
ncbi:MAG: hypothetical protein IAF38_15895 [Bacteroidia bacterium]|nr:hypothetical protein [Bacteroidia bacterium]